MDESFVGVDLPRSTRSFDPQFTADMSRRMQVPERIALTESTGRMQVAPQQESHQLAASMVVPEKLLIQSQGDPFATSTFTTAGEEFDQYEEQFPEERAPQDTTGFDTPPRRVPAPSGDGAATRRNEATLSETRPLRESSFADKNEQQQIETLRKQVVSLSRRVALLENDSQRRAKVERFLYPMVVIYLVVRVGGWLMGNSNRR